jgi:hypothetical protein
MAAGTMRRHDARLLLLSAYSAVIGVATEVEVLRAVGIEPTVRSLVRRRNELLDFLGSALLVDGREPAAARRSSKEHAKPETEEVGAGGRGGGARRRRVLEQR